MKNHPTFTAQTPSFHPAKTPLTPLLHKYIYIYIVPPLPIPLTVHPFVHHNLNTPTDPRPHNFNEELNSKAKMLVSIFLALFLPCAGMSTVFLVYIILLWFNSRSEEAEAEARASAPKPETNNGLSDSELDRIPIVSGRELVMGNDCAVCLDDIEADQRARLLPGCNHGFHLQCADTWLSKNRICPLCRNSLDPELFQATEANPC